MVPLLREIGSNLRSGAWLSPERIRAYGLISLAGFVYFSVACTASANPRHSTVASTGAPL
jgi:hypothetical protein